MECCPRRELAMPSTRGGRRATMDAAWHVSTITSMRPNLAVSVVVVMFVIVWMLIR